MSAPTSLAIALLSELLSTDQTLKAVLAHHLPKGMELSHFAVLNHLAGSGERSPAQLARTFQVTKGAMTNTLRRLEEAGHIHIRPDWEDARRKLVSISPAGMRARELALARLDEVFHAVIDELGPERIRPVLPVLRDLRSVLAKYR